MTNNEIWLISGGLLGGSAIGFIMHRSDFCLAGALRDAILFRSYAMARALLLLIVASSALLVLGRLTNVIPATVYPLFTPPTLSNLVGGFFFGIGMVLAGGCVVGVLYKLGAGSFSALLALCGLLIGSALYAEIHPWWATFMRATRLSASAVTLPQLLGVDDRLLLALLVAFGAPWLWHSRRRLPWRQPARAAGYLQPWLAALLLGLLGVASVVMIGFPLGITTAYAKTAAYIEAWFSPAHVAATPFFQVMPLNTVTPLGALPLRGGPGPNLDGISLVQYPLIVGIVGGAAVSALSLREWHWRWQLPRRQLIGVLCGGVLMGLASRLTPGCNIWHLCGGLPVLALQSLLFAVGLLPGTWVGCRLLTTWVLPIKP